MSLSTPIGELRSDYGVVVIGSGYGGAIAACRMAQHAKAQGNGLPAYSVCLLERGLEREAGDYPSAFVDSMAQIQADAGIGRIGRRTGLFDFRMNRDVSVLVGCGLGGTSLINAGVMLEPTPGVLNKQEWPQALRGTGEIESRFNQVRQALGVNPCPPDVELEKMKWLSTAAERLVVKMRPAPVAISFTTKVNQFNVRQQRCVMCGNCISGCNHSAKNTVAMNYLPGAADAGAAIFCGVETRAIERHGNWWLVHARLNGRPLRPFGSPEIVIRAKMVFLGAGTLGSTEILLRSRDRHRLSVSPQLGQRFTGNGDVIAFGYNTPDRVNGFGYGATVPRDSSVGPTIAAMIDERSDPRPDHQIMIQEGAIPGALRFVLRFGAPIMARATHIVGDVAFDFRYRHILREIDSMIRGVRHGALARTQTFLAMGHDDGKGRMRLKDNRLRITWVEAGYQQIYENIATRLQAITRVMQGRYVINPFWSRVFGRRLMTVHPLGGCCLGDDATGGVVDADGQVFSGRAGDSVHPGLYVCDGSIVPTPLGTNPALTISALAERIAAGATANPLRNAAMPPKELHSRLIRSIPGIHYAERLRGRVTLGGRPSSLRLVLHLSAESVEEAINAPEHKVRAIGMAYTPDFLPDERQWRVSEGTLNVLVDDPRRADTKLLVYRLMLTAKSGRRLWLRGHKVVNLQTLRRNPWRATTRVPFVIYDTPPKEPTSRVAAGVCERVDEWDRTRDANVFLQRPDIQTARILGAGAVKSTIADAVRLTLSTTIVREPRLMRRLRWRWRFNWGFFIRTLLELRLWMVRPTRPINPFEGQFKVRVSRPSSDVVVHDVNERMPRYQLTHYRGAECELDRDPVVLAPGFGMSTDAFRVGNPSIAQYLHDKGYSVWLLDYRGSDKLEVSLTQFTLDELAHDFTDAIHTLYKMYERRRPIRVVAHCVASLTMQMALLNGGLWAKGLHSVVLSQSFAFIDPPWFNKLKSHLHLPEVLAYFNFRPVLTSDYDTRSSARTRVLDRLLHLYPSRERCGEGVCRRLLLLYGEVIRHDQLDHATHHSLYSMFDRANLTSFKHLGNMFARGHLVDKNGNNTYLTKAGGKRVDVPITLIQGSVNGLFRPRGARRTHEWLVTNGGFGPMNAQRFTLTVIPGYGHLDNFIGRNAAKDVFPVISEALRRM